VKEGSSRGWKGVVWKTLHALSGLKALEGSEVKEVLEAYLSLSGLSWEIKRPG